MSVAAFLIAFAMTMAALSCIGRAAHRVVPPTAARLTAWWNWQPVEPPEVLIDPDGEGVYVRHSRAYAMASRILGVHWRDLHGELAWMRVDPDGEYWRRVPRSWRLHASLNLPHRWHLAADYLYVVPSEGTER